MNFIDTTARVVSPSNTSGRRKKIYRQIYARRKWRSSTTTTTVPLDLFFVNSLTWIGKSNKRTKERSPTTHNGLVDRGASDVAERSETGSLGREPCEAIDETETGEIGQTGPCLRLRWRLHLRPSSQRTEDQQGHNEDH